LPGRNRGAVSRSVIFGIRVAFRVTSFRMNSTFLTFGSHAIFVAACCLNREFTVTIVRFYLGIMPCPFYWFILTMLTKLLLSVDFN
jgi:hypothetical protein